MIVCSPYPDIQIPNVPHHDIVMEHFAARAGARFDVELLLDQLTNLTSSISSTRRLASQR
jgi:hypothetical protein